MNFSIVLLFVYLIKAVPSGSNWFLEVSVRILVFKRAIKLKNGGRRIESAATFDKG